MDQYKGSFASCDWLVIGGTAQSKKTFIFYFGKKRVRFSTLPKKKTLSTCASLSGDFGASTTKLCFCQKWRKQQHHHGQFCFPPFSWLSRLRGNLPRGRVRRGLAHTPSSPIQRQYPVSAVLSKIKTVCPLFSRIRSSLPIISPLLRSPTRSCRRKLSLWDTHKVCNDAAASTDATR